jgi:hypothetical protein
MATRDSAAARAWMGEISPEGRGLLRVLVMRASIPRSWYWFRADAPQDRMKTESPVNAPVERYPPEARMNPVSAEEHIKNARGTLHRHAYLLRRAGTVIANS